MGQRVPDLPLMPSLQDGGPPLQIRSASQAPEQAKSVTLRLQEVRLAGMTAFTERDIRKQFSEYLGRDVTLDIAWVIAGRITERYRQAGFFLSHAYVPAQQVKDGIIEIRVVEGYIEEIQADEDIQRNSIAARWLEELRRARPLSAKKAESILLRLNDIPGVALRAVIEPLEQESAAKEGGVRMNLLQQKEGLRGQVGVDNNSSKFLGPYQSSAQLQYSIAPLHRTTLTGLTSLPTEELTHVALRHEMMVMPAGTVLVYGSRTHAQPGYTLAVQEIESDSMQLGLGFDYMWIRQRDENLLTRLALEARETRADILSNTPLTRDSVRALRATAQYDYIDRWQGMNALSATISQGLDILDASPAGDTNLSRAEATPDFTKLEMQLQHSQAFPADWGLGMVIGVSGQLASGPLYSSEEFGYGGLSFGRAYDDSEITGDHGLAVSGELRYLELAPRRGVKMTPYLFYDAGIVWNEDTGQDRRASGSSAGFGIYLGSEVGFHGNLGLAWPLSRDISTPIYGDSRDPRLIVGLNYRF